MRCFNFFLGVEKPAVDFSWAKQNIVRIRIKHYWSKSIFWSVLNFVKNSLNSCKSTIPNIDNFICT
jgi:hypothetical protein